jgi:hypothetical protein
MAWMGREGGWGEEIKKRKRKRRKGEERRGRVEEGGLDRMGGENAEKMRIMLERKVNMNKRYHSSLTKHP